MAKKTKTNPNVRNGRIIVRVNVPEMDRIIKNKFLHGLNAPFSTWIREALTNYKPARKL